LNPHIHNPDRVRAGSIIALGPIAGGMDVTLPIVDLLDMQKELAVSSRETAFLLQHWDLVQALSKVEQGNETYPVPSSVTPADLATRLGPAAGAVATRSAFEFNPKLA